MVVETMMTKNPVTVTPEMSVNEVRAIMTKEKIGKLPVVDADDRLLGLVTRKDLVNVSPSAATTLDMYEISYLLAKLTVEKIMTKEVVTIQEHEVVEEAARIMADNSIGCLPVMKGDKLAGIVTESDLFHEFIEMFAARHRGVRVTFSLDEKPGQLALLTKAIAEHNGNIVSLVTADGDDMTRRRIACKISKMTRSDVEKIFKELNWGLEDIRE